MSGVGPVRADGGTRTARPNGARAARSPAGRGRGVGGACGAQGDVAWPVAGPVGEVTCRQLPNGRAYRTSGTATPSTTKGSSAPSGRNPARS